ncbi:MAG: NAD-dependent epimerase/dehydratase family protein [Planctomycetota bacterium]|nr:MAG: NAD-dependent epimerase/dehydratase family protein [Planctomycetota bacterium]
MKHLITGGAGFIGSHLAEALLDKGETVFVIDDLSTGSIVNIDHLRDRDNFHYAIDTILNEQLLSEYVDRADVVHHLAAAVGVRLIVEDPVRTIETNIAGTDLVLRAAAKKKRRTLIASTSEVYGKSSDLPFVEDGDMVLGATTRARWSYAASKAIDEFLALAYHAQFGLPVTVLRFFNTVGPRQTGRYGMVIPRFVGQALGGEPITVYGDGKQSRCFCDVSDVIRAVMELVDRPESHGQVYNIGSTEEITIVELAEKVRKLFGPDSEIEFVSFEEAYGPNFEDLKRRVPDTNKLHELIGWEPKVKIDEILNSVVAYIRKNM